MSEPTLEEVLDLLDPDWSARWRGDADTAAKFYRTFNPEGWAEITQELLEEG